MAESCRFRDARRNASDPGSLLLPEKAPWLGIAQAGAIPAWANSLPALGEGRTPIGLAARFSALAVKCLPIALGGKFA